MLRTAAGPRSNFSALTVTRSCQEAMFFPGDDLVLSYRLTFQSRSLPLGLSSLRIRMGRW